MHLTRNDERVAQQLERAGYLPMLAEIARELQQQDGGDILHLQTRSRSGDQPFFAEFRFRFENGNMHIDRTRAILPGAHHKLPEAWDERWREWPGLVSADQACKGLTPKMYVLPQEEKTMNEQNLEYLNNSVKYLGFEEKTAAVMDTKIRQGIPEFQVTAQHDHFNNRVFHTLHFKKSAETDMYFFNKYDAKLSNGKPEEDKTQTFYIKNGQGFTAKEAFNLLEGRAVHKELKNKEGQPYAAWTKLDLDKDKDKNNNYPVRQYTSGWGYDLEKSVSRFPVKELQDEEQKAILLRSLQKGNQQQVTIDKDGKPEKFYLEAVPNLRTVNIYDTKRNEVKRETLLKPGLKVKKEKKADQSEAQKQGRKKSRGKGI